MSMVRMSLERIDSRQRKNSSGRLTIEGHGRWRRLQRGQSGGIQSVNILVELQQDAISPRSRCSRDPAQTLRR